MGWIATWGSRLKVSPRTWPSCISGPPSTARLSLMSCRACRWCMDASSYSFRANSLRRGSVSQSVCQCTPSAQT
eukprot:757663-Pyramimonas_sp.AAC.1